MMTSVRASRPSKFSPPQSCQSGCESIELFLPLVARPQQLPFLDQVRPSPGTVTGTSIRDSLSAVAFEQYGNANGRSPRYLRWVKGGIRQVAQGSVASDQ